MQITEDTFKEVDYCKCKIAGDWKYNLAYYKEKIGTTKKERGNWEGRNRYYNIQISRRMHSTFSIKQSDS